MQRLAENMSLRINGLDAPSQNRTHSLAESQQVRSPNSSSTQG